MPCFGKLCFVDREWAIGDAVKIWPGLFRETDSSLLHFAIKLDEEVVDIEIVLEKDIVLQIGKIRGAQRNERDADAWHICGDTLSGNSRPAARKPAILGRSASGKFSMR